MGILNVFKKDDKEKEKSAAGRKVKSSVKKEPAAAPERENSDKSSAPKTISAEFRKSSSGTEIKPRITEKTSRYEALGKYTFEVSADSTKPEIKKAVEEIYKTKVASVNLANVISKRLGRMRKGYGMRGGFRKAVVTLKPGEKINLT